MTVMEAREVSKHFLARRGLFGGTRGGPAKVAVVASGMMGTISGSGVANVVTVGQFTIPLMIRFGYRRAFAAGDDFLVRCIRHRRMRAHRAPSINLRETITRMTSLVPSRI